LIVDDEAFNLIVLEGLLLQYGGIESVDTANNGKEALEMIEKNI
jgi:CheY-like chemotaxis protein